MKYRSIYIELRIESGAVTADAIAQAINISPAWMREKGSFLPNGRVRDSSTWKVDTSHIGSKIFSDHVEEFKRMIDGKISALQEISERAAIELNIILETDCEFDDVMIPAWLLNQASLMRASVEIYLYDFSK